MQQALELAQKGRGLVLPNPLVGCVVVKNNQIVGKGYHQKFGEAHAEVNALQDAGSQARGATLYVTLEPCCHTGKTPPCTNEILQCGIKKVVIACSDPNPLVSGKGIKQLIAAGIEVVSGVLQDEACHLNRVFNKFIRSRKPYITLKIAQTLDGKIADINHKSKWISGELSRECVHRMRFESGAVLVGAGTVFADNPRLTVRTFHISEQPWRIVIDPKLIAPLNSLVFADELKHRTLVLISKDQSQKAKAEKLVRNGVKIVVCDQTATGHFDLNKLLDKLGEMGLAHILVEGGQKIFSSFFKQKCIDELQIFIAPKLFGQGLSSLQVPGWTADSPCILENTSWNKMGNDLLFTGYFQQT